MAPQRRRERRRERRRKVKGRFRGLYKLLAAAVILIALTVACIIFFRVQTVEVTGVSRYSPEQIIQASGIQEGDYLAALNINRVVRQIQTSLPYVKRVSVSRSLPDTVVITVEESPVAAALQSGGQWWLLNSAGKLLESVSQTQASAYPQLSGMELTLPEEGGHALVAEEQQSRWDCALALLAALEERGELSKLDSLDCSGAGSFTLRYDQFYTLLMPVTINYAYADKAQFSYFFSLLDEARPTLEEEARDIVDFTLWENTGYIYARRSK